MKRYLLAVVASVCFMVSLQAQTCVIDTNNANLLSPTSEELPCVERNVPYSIVLQLFTPPNIGGVGVDSIAITTFNGLPTGITNTCNPVNCTMVGFGRACITLAGTTSDSVGAYLIDYDGFAYTEQGTAPFDYLRDNFPGIIPEYTLFVINAGGFCVNTGSTGISSNNVESTAGFSVSPNPGNGVFQFRLNHVSGLGGDILVTDMAGRVVYNQKNTAGFFDTTTIDLTGFAKGMYLLQYRTGNGVSSKKIIVQ